VEIVATSYNYIRNHCFISQLIAALEYVDGPQSYYFTHPEKRRALEVDGLWRDLSSNFRFWKHSNSDSGPVLLVLPQRVIQDKLYDLCKLIDDRPVIIYDEDPWRSYEMSSPTLGSLKRFQKCFNLIKIYVPSFFWHARLRNDGLNAEFFRMGIDPKLTNKCINGFRERSIGLAFRGTLRPHRREIFDKLNRQGLDVRVFAESLKHKEYLTWLRKVKVFIHDESGAWECSTGSSELISMSTGMWARDVEIAAQGCFVIRNFHIESESYDMSKIPLVKLYKDLDDVKEIYDEILNLSHDEVTEIQRASLLEIQSRQDWISLATKICNIAKFENVDSM
jgi:hypothetical protein